jgi:hypothetical protein
MSNFTYYSRLIGSCFPKLEKAEIMVFLTECLEQLKYHNSIYLLYMILFIYYVWLAKSLQETCRKQ